jgi:hypothetical protein
MLAISGLDLNNPPEMELPELLSVYSAAQPAVAWPIRGRGGRDATPPRLASSDPGRGKQ